MMDYPIVIVPLSESEGGGYAGYAVDLPGCMSDGDTQEEALKNTLAAVQEWIDAMTELGREIPAPNSAATAAIAARTALISAYREAKQAFDGLEPRIARLEDVMQELQERAENEMAWTRFTVITGVSFQPSREDEGQRRLT